MLGEVGWMWWRMFKSLQLHYTAWHGLFSLHCCCCCSALRFKTVNPGCLFFFKVLVTSLGPSPQTSTQCQQRFPCCTVCLIWLATEISYAPHWLITTILCPNPFILSKQKKWRLVWNFSFIGNVLFSLVVWVKIWSIYIFSSTMPRLLQLMTHIKRSRHFGTLRHFFKFLFYPGNRKKANFYGKHDKKYINLFVFFQNPPPLLLYWMIWAGMLLTCRHIIFMFCAFPRNWVPAFKLNTSKLVPVLPGTNLGPVCVGDTHKTGTVA